ncbi:MAG: SLC13 family permease [Roseovarius sp.]|nr:SLC13 family permease [Roseovarius sp.]
MPIELLEIPDAAQPVIALAIVAGMFALFVREVFPAEVVALAGAAAMMSLGLLPYEDALHVLANPAPWTIAAMFIVMGGLVRTGALDAFILVANRLAKAKPGLAVGFILGFVAIASAFMNNTPVVVVMIPIFIQLSKSLDILPSKLLIPLSYAAIMGGMLTLIGTSSNLLVDGVARSKGLEAFTIFEITPLAAIIVVWGMFYLTFIAPFLLPDRTSMSGLLNDPNKKRYFTEVIIPDKSELAGRNVEDVNIFKRQGVRLIDVIRGDRSFRNNLKDAVLEAGDRVVLRTKIAEVLSMQHDRNLRVVNQVSEVMTTTVEVLVTPGCNIVGRSIGELRLVRRYGIYPLAVHRRNQNIGSQIDDLTIKVGDTLLLEGSAEEIQRLANDMGLLNVSEPSARGYRRNHAPIALAALAGIVFFAALGVAPILLLAVLAMALILITKCIDSEEAFSFIDGRLLALIFSMLAVAMSLETSGAVDMIVNGLSPYFAMFSPFFLIWSVYLLTSAMSELINHAIAVVLTPVAISLAYNIGVDPRPLVVTVMFASAATFTTPISYQTNMMVYGPGGYKFTDFLKVGIPLNISVGLLASAAIPFIWPL